MIEGLEKNIKQPDSTQIDSSKERSEIAKKYKLSDVEKAQLLKTGEGDEGGWEILPDGTNKIISIKEYVSTKTELENEKQKEENTELDDKNHYDRIMGYQ